MEEIRSRINIKKFILKAILYVVFLCFLFPILLFLFSLPLAVEYLNPWSEEPPLTDFITNLIAFYIPFIFSPLASYMLAKLFGIFKFIDNLKVNMFKKLLLLTLLAVLSFLILIIKFKYVDNEKYFSCYMSTCIFTLIPAFFLYKFFKYLTKKHPVPFEKIGYYSSVEFWKKLILRK